MKRILFALLFTFLISLAYSYDTYLFRVKVNNTTNKKANVEAVFSSKGRYNEQDQPFYATYVLSQPDTNYVLIKITPSDNVENEEMKINFGVLGIDLYRVYRIDDNGVQLITDNSKKYPVDTNWSVKKSS